MFASILVMSPDCKHVKHLGCDQYLYDTVLWLLCYHVLAGPPKDNLNAVWARIHACYMAQKAPYQYNSMELSMFIDPSQPYKTFPN